MNRSFRQPISLRTAIVALGSLVLLSAPFSEVWAENAAADSSNKSDRVESSQSQSPPAKSKEASGIPSDKSKDAKANAEKDKGPNEDNWKDYLAAAQTSYKEGKLDVAANDLELALLGAERLREGAKGEAFLHIGEQYLYLKQYEKAKILLEEAIRLRRSIPGFKSIASANALDTLAQAYARTGNLEEAKKSEAEALATYEALKKTDTTDYAIALSNHANTLRAMKQYKEAEQFFAKAVSAQQKIDKGDSIELAKILLNAGGMYCDMNKLDSAKRLLDRAHKIVRGNLKPEHPLYKLSLKSERVLYKKKADSLLKADTNPYRENVAIAVGKLAELYEEEGDPSQALAAYKQAIDIRERLNPDSPELSRLRQRYEVCHMKLSSH